MARGDLRCLLWCEKMAPGVAVLLVYAGTAILVRVVPRADRSFFITWSRLKTELELLTAHRQLGQDREMVAAWMLLPDKEKKEKPLPMTCRSVLLSL